MKRYLIVVLGVMIGLLAGCGKKDKVETEINLYSSSKIVEEAMKVKTPSKRIVDFFDGNVMLDNMEIQCGKKVKDQPNKQWLLDNYFEALEEYGECNGVTIYCDNYEVDIEERTITGVSTGGDISNITLKDKGYEKVNSIQELFEQYGAPDYLEELDGNGWMQVFGVIYREEGKRVDVQIYVEYDGDEAEGTYSDIVSQKIVHMAFELEK